MEDVILEQDLDNKKENAIDKFKEWIKEQIWTKAFRKAYGLSIRPYKRSSKKQRRNALCECNSGLKYKKCCYGKAI